MKDLLKAEIYIIIILAMQHLKNANSMYNFNKIYITLFL